MENGGLVVMPGIVAHLSQKGLALRRLQSLTGLLFLIRMAEMLLLQGIQAAMGGNSRPERTIMKPLHTLSVGMALLLLAILGPGLRAEDWTTSDGTVYKDVHVVKVEADAVTIIHHDGGALVPLVKLPAALQQQFGYDPAKAKAAADTRAKIDGESQEALQVEKAEAQKMQDAKEAKYKADKKAVEDEKAAAAAAEPPNDPLHVGQYAVGRSDDTRTHYQTQQAFATNDPKMPVMPAPTVH